MNEPIMSADVQYESYSRQWIYKEIKKLCQDGKMVKYEVGVYYLPTYTALGQSVLNPRKVIEKKYIQGGKGYYSGSTFLNQIGISSQMPNIIEIYTNSEKSNVRSIKVGNQKVILRKARTEINPSNTAALSFLEMMTCISPSYLNSERKKIVVEFILDNNITRRDITRYSAAFPDRTMRNMIESEVIYDVLP
jgi:hypothetical protein